jgi:phenylacetate-CoA ligase
MTFYQQNKELDTTSYTDGEDTMTRLYWDEEVETLSREKLEQLQLSLLKETVAFAQSNSPYYRQLWHDHGISANDVRHLQDLEKFPFMNKKTLRERQQVKPPFGDIVAVPETEIVYLSASSGSTGVPTASPFTARDFDEFQDCEARFFWSSGMRPHDRYCHALQFTLFVGGPCVIGAQKLGALSLWVGTVPSERLLKIFEQWQPTVTWTTPSYAWFLGETAQKQGIDPRSLSIRRIFVAGEPGGSIPETKARIEELWNAKVYDYYGLSDIFGACAAECEAQSGPHMAEDHILVEVLDPDTGQPVAEGERGEMVVTSLKKRARPLIRFRTGDIVKHTTERCSCGRTHLRLSGVLGRVDDMVIINGVNVFPSDIESIVRQQSELTGEYRLVVTEQQHLKKLVVEAETVDTFHGDVEGLAQHVAKACKSIIGITPSVVLHPQGTLPRESHKAKRLIRE